MRQKHSAFDLTLFLFPGWEIGLQTRSLHLSLSLVTTAIVLALFDSRAPTCHFGPPVHKFLAISGAFHSTKIAEIPGGEANGTNFGYTSRGCPNVPENRLDHSDRKLLFHSKKKSASCTSLSYISGNFCPKLNGTVRTNRAGITNRKISGFTVPFAIFSFQNFKSEFLVEWKAPLGSHFRFS